MELPGYNGKLARQRGTPGLVHGSGETWKVHRRFTVSSLGKIEKEFDVEASILEEIQSVVASLETACSHNGKVLITLELFSVATLNTIWQMIAGHKFINKEKDKILQISSSVTLDSNKVNMAARAVTHAYPVLRGTIQWLGLSFPPDRIKGIVEMFRNDAKLSYKSQDPCRPDKDLSNSTHSTLVERFYAQMTSGRDCQQDQDDLTAILLDLFDGSLHTTSSAICSALLYLTAHPDVQEKVHNELDLAFGKDNMALRASYARDRHLTPYTEAVILETLRLSNIVPKTSHQANEDTYIDKYFIPKDTLVISHFTEVHKNPSVFSYPEKFDPSRFLNSDGCFVGDARVVAFGIGKRRCLGENLAKIQLYMFITGLLQCFKFQPDGPLALEQHSGPTAFTKPFRVQVLPRWINKRKNY